MIHTVVLPQVNLNCWNTTEEMTTWMKTQNFGLDADAYYGQWSVFQEKSRQLLTQAIGGVEVPGILWTSHLTEKGRVDKYLNNTQYIIQIWTTGKDNLIAELLQKQYKVIFQHKSYLFLSQRLMILCLFCIHWFLLVRFPGETAIGTLVVIYVLYSLNRVIPLTRSSSVTTTRGTWTVVVVRGWVKVTTGAVHTVDGRKCMTTAHMPSLSPSPTLHTLTSSWVEKRHCGANKWTRPVWMPG